MEVSTMKLIEYIKNNKGDDNGPIVRIILSRSMTDEELKAFIDAVND